MDKSVRLVKVEGDVGTSAADGEAVVLLPLLQDLSSSSSPEKVQSSS